MIDFTSHGKRTKLSETPITYIPLGIHQSYDNCFIAIVLVTLYYQNCHIASVFVEKSVTVFAVIAVIGVFYYVQILYVGSWYLLSTGDDTQIISVYYTVHYSIATVILYVVNLEK